MALGGGDPAAVPAVALEELVAAEAADVRADGPLAAFLAGRGVRHADGAPLIAADDATAWRLVRADATLTPSVPSEDLAARAAAQELAAVWAITVRLRRDCPWDREQTPATIVPHTIEEAYEVADVALAGPPDAKLVDELGDLLFQSFILAVMAREAGAGDLMDVARGIADKLVRRHPHVFGDVAAETADAVLLTWEGVKRDQEGREGIFHDIPESLPTMLQAQKAQKRAAAVGFDWGDWTGADVSLREEVDELAAAVAAHPATGPEPAPAVRDEAGDVLFAAINVLRLLRVDPETALRAASARFRARVDGAAALAAADGRAFADLGLDDQERYYRAAKARQADDPQGAR